MAVAILEIALRLVPDRQQPDAPHETTLKTYWDFVLPNRHGLWEGREFASNSAGFRSPEIPLVGPNPRVVVTGDSFTAGCGVDGEEAYPRVAERLLRADGIDVDVINIGVPGNNASAAVGRIRAAERYRPRVLAYGVTMNDIEGPRYVARAADLRRAHDLSYWRFAQSPLFTLRYAWPALESLADAAAPEGSYEREALSNWLDNPGAWQEFEGALDRLKTVAHGRCVVIMTHPYLAHLHPWHPFLPVYDRIGSAARERGFTFADPFARFRWRRGKSFWIRPSDPHPNAAAHLLLAAELASALKRLPASCWQGR